MTRHMIVGNQSLHSTLMELKHIDDFFLKSERMSLQSDSQDAGSAIELAPVHHNEGMADAQDKLVSATQDNENSATGNCFVRALQSLLSFLNRFGWVAKWVTLFLALWTTVDMDLMADKPMFLKPTPPTGIEPRLLAWQASMLPLY